MPYGNTTPRQDSRIDRCVARLIASGTKKDSAYAICISSVKKAGKVRKHLAKS